MYEIEPGLDALWEALEGKGMDDVVLTAQMRLFLRMGRGAEGWADGYDMFRS